MMSLGYGEMLLFGAIALLLFGQRLPEVARSLGGSYRELKKNLNDFQREFTAIDHIDVKPTRPKAIVEEKIVEPAAPKFTPPPSDE